MYCACHAKGSRGPSGGHARRSSSRRLCVLRLPRQRQPRPQRTRAAARPGGSVYCACHAKARRSSSRRPCVLRLTRERQPRPQRRPRAPQLVQEALCIAPATPKAAAAPAAATHTAARPGGFVYCACHAKGSRGPSGGHACRSSSRRLCVLRLPRQRQPRPQRRPRTPQLVQEALCPAPATPKAAAAPAAATRAAARPGGSVYCACHAKGSRGPSGGHARRSSARRLCVVRLPRKRQALCTAPA